MTTYLLTGDIGGTNSRMFLYDPAISKPLWEHSYKNEDEIPPNPHLLPNVFTDKIIIPFLEECWDKRDLAPIDDCLKIVAVLAVAGVVQDNRVELTNRGNMLIDGSVIERSKRNRLMQAIVRCRIINDFVAQGYGCLTLKRSEVHQLYGPPSNVENLPIGPKVCVGAGTGLGECYLTPDANGSYTCFASEGGHVEFAPHNNDVEIKMMRYLVDRIAKEEGAARDRISVERVVSGKGLANVYDFLAHEYQDTPRFDQAIHDEFLTAADDQGLVVAKNSVVKGSLCDQAMSIMMRAYGCEVGSAAINWIPKGGLFVSGGLTPKNMERIKQKQGEFMSAYLNKGRVQPILETVPLFAVKVDELGQRGAHKAALIEYENIVGFNVAKSISGLGAFLKDHGLVIAVTASISAATGFFLRKRA